MAHVLQAYLLLSSRDPRRVRLARPVLARAAGLPANERERLHLAAIAAALADDYERAKARWGELLRLHPRDVLALQVAHAFDYLTGDLARMNDRVAAVLPAWSSDLPGYHAVLAMHAFSLEECGEYERAEQAARAALALNAFDARAHHVMAHVFEMTERPDAGVRWMNEHIAYWGANTVVATHCWWHLALFHLAQGQVDQALALYDRRIRAGHSSGIADLIDAAALLWRVELRGGNTGTRWGELAAAWAPHIDDGFCSFNDLHAMLAFVGARDWDRAQRLELALARGGVAADALRRDHAAARPARLPRADRVRPRQRHRRDHAAREPAGAGAPTWRQPCAARRAAPDSAACHRTHSPARPPAARRAPANPPHGLKPAGPFLGLPGKGTLKTKPGGGGGVTGRGGGRRGAGGIERFQQRLLHRPDRWQRLGERLTA